MPILPTFEAESKSSIMTKENKYQTLLPQIKALIEGEDDIVSLMANTAAALREEMSFFWVGFYLVKDAEWLSLGPFQGSVACSRISHGRGVCGTAWARRATVVVEDVDKFPGHIACSSLSRSEIVVPVFNQQGEVAAVLDIDSTDLATFDTTDQYFLERMMKSLSRVMLSR